MTLTDRDRKIMLVLIPLVLVVGYWFLLLSPARKDATAAGAELTKQQEARDSAVARAAQVEGSKGSFKTDYASLVRLGKAVPTTLDMPSLIVQLDSAAKGTGIRFNKVAAGEPAQAAATPPPASPPPSGGSKPPADAGGSSAASAPGSAAEKANDTKAAGDKSAAQKSGVDATTSSSGKKGGLPVGGGATNGAAPAAAGACAPGLECVPLDFEFRGSFFDLADFFHQLKRFVHVANQKVNVNGRLMTIDGFKFTTEEDSFPKLQVEVQATVYLSPKKQGSTAGATPQGPAPSAGQSQSASAGGSSSPTPTPTATATGGSQ